MQSIYDYAEFERCARRANEVCPDHIYHGQTHRRRHRSSGLLLRRRRTLYNKLKRALYSEIDESARSALYQTTSYPLEKPESGKIAVKVINHYGDEVLKVYEV